MAIYDGEANATNLVDKEGATVIYFNSQDKLDEFLKGDQVPEGEWYASVGDRIFETYGEQAVFNLGGTSDTQSVGSTTVTLSDNHTDGYAAYFDIASKDQYNYEVQIKQAGKYRVIIHAVAGQTGATYSAPTLKVQDRDNNTITTLNYSSTGNKEFVVSGSLVIDKAGYYSFASQFLGDRGADELNINGTVEFRQITQEGEYSE